MSTGTEEIRKLGAIMFTDMVGYGAMTSWLLGFSRNIGQSIELRTYETLYPRVVINLVADNSSQNA